jgi:hypothetical protein
VRAALSKAKSIILVPKKVTSKKRNISQLKGKKDGPTKKKLKVETKAPVIVATKNLEISAISESTKSLVAKLLKEKKKSEVKEDVKMANGDVISIKPYSSSTADLISKLKPSVGVQPIVHHPSLISVSHKLVLPSKYRSLVQMQEFLDSTLNFLGTRHPDWIPLKEVKQSIAITQGKGFTLDMLRKILNFCPDFYEIKWQENKYIDPALCIRFVSGARTLNHPEKQLR